MMERITKRGYGKINLHLDITGRMPDGYHCVETVMQSVSLCDEVTLTPRREPFFDASCNVAGVPTDEKNLVVRAALLFREQVPCDFGAHIAIEKSIPMAAGMAGGSADAAAVLLGMNELCGSPLTTEQLCALGSRLGADVPFCVVGGTAFADGRGDVLHPLPPMPSCHLVIACAGEGVSTPWAYGLLDQLHGNFEAGCGYHPKETEPLIDALRTGDLSTVSSSLYNIFEEPVLTQRPVAASIKALLLANGAMGAMMSGSGPSVFGIFDVVETATAASDVLKAEGYQPYLCTPKA